MMEKIAEAEHLMAPILDGMQLRHLHAVLVSCFCEGEETLKTSEDDAERCIDAFLSAKKLEGCSGRSLGYYAATLRRFSEAVPGGERGEQRHGRQHTAHTLKLLLLA